MELRLKGHHPKLSNKDIRKMSKWILVHIMPDKSLARLSVTIEFKDKFRQFEGICCSNDSNNRFKIEIRNKMSKKNTLQTIAHELVHVKQFFLGELTLCQRSGRHLWKGKRTDPNGYWDQPWELEAYGREQGLVAKFRDSVLSEQ